jgi:hypothetical protein
MTTLDLTTLTLDKGAHDNFAEGACLLEAASYMAGEPWTDHPACVSRVIGTFGRSLNDSLPAARRQELKTYIPAMLNTADDGQDEARSYMALDWLIRTYTPAFLDLAGLTVEAQSLRDLRRIVDLVAAQNAGPVVRQARMKAAAAWAAAGAAAWAAAGAAAWAAAGAAAWDAAGAAARAAAWDAAGAAARDAARDAARAAAWAAARAAARDVLQPTVDTLQTSAIALLGEMINPALVTK